MNNEREWLHEVYPNDMAYYWKEMNKVMRNDEHGVEIHYRFRHVDDDICGAQTIRPGIPRFEGKHYRADQSVDHLVTCTFVGDHGEMPHIGVPADCAALRCQCYAYGNVHVVIVGFVIRKEAPSWVNSPSR